MSDVSAHDNEAQNRPAAAPESTPKSAPAHDATPVAPATPAGDARPAGQPGAAQPADAVTAAAGERGEHEPPKPAPELRSASRKAMVKYGLARLVLFLVLTVVIQGLAMLIGAPVPLIFSALLALFLALPLSMLIFTKWRLEATNSLAEYSRQRKAHKAWVQRELAGRN